MPVVLWSDALFYLLLLAAVGLFIAARRKPQLRRSWCKVFKNKLGMIAAVILASYCAIAFLDCLHFRTVNGDIDSVLDVMLQPASIVQEQTYSAPFALHLFNKQMIYLSNGQQATLYPELKYAGFDLKKYHRTEAQDIIIHSMIVLSKVIPIMAMVLLLMALCYGLNHGIDIMRALKNILTNKTELPWRLCWITLFIVVLVMWLGIGLSKEYHVLGTNKVGQDVFYLTIKSIRTGLLIGTITTLVMVPFALLCGMAAGYFRGWIDDVVQYLYTTLSSIPAVLLIVAAVLSIQIFLSNHPQFFTSMEQRADVRLLALCIILGVTSWTSLCRILRGETLKLREMDYVQAAVVLGTPARRIMTRHILPNVMYLILITVVLDFSALVLAEAVLTYVGVGVDPSTISWGNMINSARLELAREPVVWWPLCAAFIFMSVLVLSANLFADAVRDGFDPRMSKMT